MMRDYRNEDAPIIEQYLAGAGLNRDQMVFDRYVTRVFDRNDEVVAFYTYREMFGSFYLDHFFVRSDLRIGKNAQGPFPSRALLRDLKASMQTLGLPRAIFNAPEEDKQMQRMIEVALKGRPYAAKEGLLFYLTEVSHV